MIGQGSEQGSEDHEGEDGASHAGERRGKEACLTLNSQRLHFATLPRNLSGPLCRQRRQRWREELLAEFVEVGIVIVVVVAMAVAVTGVHG